MLHMDKVKIVPLHMIVYLYMIWLFFLAPATPINIFSKRLATHELLSYYTIRFFDICIFQPKIWKWLNPKYNQFFVLKIMNIFALKRTLTWIIVGIEIQTDRQKIIWVNFKLRPPSWLCPPTIPRNEMINVAISMYVHL